LGGDHGYSAWVNDSGEVVGAAANQNLLDLLAFYWKDGVMTSLGTLEGDSCSAADAINSSGLIVGGSGFSTPPPFFPGCTDPVEHAVIWENGQIFDLNLLVTNPSDLTLTEATFINDKGEISGFGILPSSDTHAFLLIPCDEKNLAEGCDGATADVVANQNTTATMVSPEVTANQNRAHAVPMSSGFGFRRGLQPRVSAIAILGAPTQLTSSVVNSYQIKLRWLEASGQNVSGFNIYRCKGCINPRTLGTKVASVGAGTLAYTDGSTTTPLTETTAYTYQVTSYSAAGESGSSNMSSATTATEPAPTNLSSYGFIRSVINFGQVFVVHLLWTNNSSDNDSYFLEGCGGATCTNFTELAQLSATTTSDILSYRLGPTSTVRYRVRAHSAGGYSSYSNIRNQIVQ
jgi:probable HAF family extracellular repeat protein